jgi:hypothetical protein
LSTERLKIKLKKNTIILTISWPGAKKSKDKIGPLFSRVSKSRFEVVRKGETIVISMGKESKGKWG